MFYFLTHRFDILKAIWLLSQDQVQEFPLFLVSIRITRIVTDALLAGQLSAVVNKAGRDSIRRGRGANGSQRQGDGGLFETTCLMHTAGLFHFYYVWRHHKHTIEDAAKTYAEVDYLMTKKPAKLLKDFIKIEAM